ncbi:MAG: MerR family transcriptional regulator [Acidobacteriota bacterium]
MADTNAGIPDREWFKASEVCEMASLQPYVLRSWELEFPNLGVQRSAGAPRWYRRSDVERVLRIRQLVFGEGLTLAGARRRIDGDSPGADHDEPAVIDRETRARLAAIRRELRTLHEWLSEGSPVPARATGPAAEVARRTVPEVVRAEKTRGVTPWPSKPQRRQRKGGRKS